MSGEKHEEPEHQPFIEAAEQKYSAISASDAKVKLQETKSELNRVERAMADLEDVADGTEDDPQTQAYRTHHQEKLRLTAELEVLSKREV